MDHISPHQDSAQERNEHVLGKHEDIAKEERSHESTELSYSLQQSASPELEQVYIYYCIHCFRLLCVMLR